MKIIKVSKSSISHLIQTSFWESFGKYYTFYFIFLKTMLSHVIRSTWSCSWPILQRLLHLHMESICAFVVSKAIRILNTVLSHVYHWGICKQMLDLHCLRLQILVARIKSSPQVEKPVIAHHTLSSCFPWPAITPSSCQVIFFFAFLFLLILYNCKKHSLQFRHYKFSLNYYFLRTV
jgi:hypothetical protein